MGLVETANRNRGGSSRNASQRPASLGTGLGTGAQIEAEDPYEKLGSNIQRATRLSAVQEGQEDDGFLKSAMNFGIDMYDKSGLDAALEFIDRGKKAINLVMQDNLVASMFVAPVQTLPLFAANLLRKDGGGSLQADQRYGYEITAQDYFDVLAGRMDQVEERMGIDTADALLGISRDISGSAVLDANRVFTSEWVNALPQGAKQLAATGRFGAAFGLDIANDPFTYVTGGMGGLGRNAAKTAVNGAVRTSLRLMTDDIVRAGSSKAAREVIEAGTYNALDKLAAKRILARVDDLVGKGAKGSFDDIVRKEAGYSKELFMRTDDSVEGGVKVLNMAADDDELFALAQWADEAAGRQSVYSEIQTKLGQNMETKFFDDTSEVWQAWVDTARLNPKTIWTTGGLRFGQGQVSSQIPWITDKTRGLQRRATKRVFGSKPARRVFQTPEWKNQVVRWDSLRAKLSREAPEAIKAAQGTSRLTYSAYINTYQEAPRLAVKALDIDSAIRNINLQSDWATILNDVKKSMPENLQDDFMNRLRSSIGSGTTPDLSELDNFPAAQARAVKFVEVYDEMYQELAGKLALVDPEFEKMLKQNTQYRPLSWDEDNAIIFRDMEALNRSRINTLIADTSGNVTQASRQAFADKHGFSVAQLDSFLSVLDTFADTTGRSRPFGETSELHWRKLGRTGMIVDGVNEDGFRSLADINTSIIKVRDAFVEELDYSSKALKRNSEKVGSPALELDPVKQMDRYLEDISTAIAERAIVGEAMRSGLMAQSSKGLNIDAVTALMAAAKENDDVNFIGRVAAAIAETEKAIKSQDVYQASLYVDMVPVKLSNGRTFNVSRELLDDPDYRKLIAELEDLSDKAVQIAKDFPNEYRKQRQKIVAAARRAGEDLSDEQAQAMTLRQMSSSINAAEARYSVEVANVIRRKAETAGEMYRMLGDDAATEIERYQGYVARQVQATSETIEEFRQAYVQTFIDEAADMEGIDLLSSTNIEEMAGMITSAGPRNSEYMLEAARTSADEAAEKLRIMSSEGGSYIDVRNARYDLDVAANFAEALEAKLAGETLSGHGVGQVSIRSFPEDINGSDAVRLIADTIGLSDESIVVGSHNASLPPRMKAMDESSASLFFYSPMMADDSHETFQVLYYAVEGKKLPRVPDNEFVLNWWNETFQMHKGGLWMPRVDPKTGKGSKVVVLSRMNRDVADANDQINFLQTFLRERSRGSDVPINVAIEMPNVVGPTKQFTVAPHREYAVQNIGSHPDIKRELVDKLGMSEDQASELIWNFNKGASVPASEINDRRITRQVEAAARGEVDTKTEVSGLLSTRRQARDVAFETEQLAENGFVYNPIIEEWEYVGETGGVGNPTHLINLTDSDFTDLNEAFITRMEQLQTLDVQPTVGIDDAFQDPKAETIIDSIRGLQAEGAGPEDEQVQALLFRLKELEEERVVPPGTIRRPVEEGAEVDEGVLSLVPEMKQASKPPSMAQPGTEYLDTYSQELAQTLKENYGFNDLQVSEAVSEFQKQITDPNRFVQGEHVPVNVGEIVKKMRNDEMASWRWRFTAQSDIVDRVYPPGTVLDIPSEARALSWLTRGQVDEKGFIEAGDKLPFTGKGELPPVQGVEQFDVVQPLREGVEGPRNLPEKASRLLEESRQSRRVVAGDELVSKEVDPGKRIAEEADRALSEELTTGFESIPPGEMFEQKAIDTELIPGAEGVPQQPRGGGVEAIQEDELYKNTNDARIMTQQIKTDADMGEFVSGVLSRVFGRRMSPEDSLIDPARRKIAADLQEGVIRATRQVWNDPEVKAILKRERINVEKVTRMVRSLDSGDLSVIDDPDFQKFMAIVNDRYTWDVSPGEWQAAHPGIERPRLKTAPPEAPAPAPKVAQAGKSTYEVSTAGDKRFSALNAKLADGKTIEYHYQVNYKGYSSIKEGKGQPPKPRGDVVPTKAETKEAYLQFWRDWADANPSEMQDLVDKAAGRPLSDKFAAKGAVNSQSDALTQVITERGLAPTRLATPARPTDTLGIRKIISGGQVGADRLGLELGVELGIETGGTAPKGFKTSKGGDPGLGRDFGLVADASDKYPPRTIKNIKDSDGTVVFGADVNSPGTKLTRNEAKKAGKPYLENPTPAQFKKWVEENNVKTLNIAGNRSFTDRNAMRAVFETADEVPASGWSMSTAEVNAASETMASNMDRQITQLDTNMQQLAGMMSDAAGKQDSGSLVDIVERVRSLDDVPVEERSLVRDQIVEDFVANKEALNQAAKAVWGPEAEFTLMVGMEGTDGKPIPAIITPRSDRASIDAAGGFDDALQAMRDGELTPAQAYAKDMPQVARAREAEKALEDVLAISDGVLSTAKRQAQVVNMLDHYNNVVSAVDDAIERGSAKKLRPLVSDWNGHTYVYSPEFKKILTALEDTPAQREWLMRYIESGWVADIEWSNKRNFDLWWMQERKTMANLDWSLEFNQRQLDKIQDQIMGMEQTLFPPEDMSSLSTLLTELTANMAQMDRFAASPSAVFPSRAGARPFADADTGVAEIRTSAERRVARASARKLKDEAIASDVVDNVIGILEAIPNNRGFKKLDANDAKIESDIMNRWLGLQEDMRNIRSAPQTSQRFPRAGLVQAESVGLGSGITAGLDVDPLFAEFISSTLNNTKSVFSPYAISETQRVTRYMINWWKAAATVVKPSFHIRNVLGGVQNGYIAGVHMSDYKAVMSDVTRFRKALADVTRNGTGDVGNDVFRDVVLKSVSQKNQKMFEAAWESNVLQTSFTRAEMLYDLGGKTNFNPFSTQNIAFQKGGQAMEYIEDVLRMATFNRWFDDSALDVASSASTARSIVNAVHFDYSALTDMERKIKNFMPFYVWTRRNIPLQMRVLTQNPSFMLWYQRARSNWNDQELATIEDIDPFTRWQAQQGFVLPYQRGDDAQWARLMWDPQMPAYDLDSMPLFQEGVIPVGSSVFDGGAWMTFLTDNAGPLLSVPFETAQLSEEYGSTNAPAGLNAVLRGLDAITPSRFLTGEGYPDATSSLAPDVDYRINKWQNATINTAFPFYKDYRAFLGIKPNNPYVASSEGWLPGDDPGTLDPMRVALGPLGRVVGRGAGFGWVTPTDIYFDAIDTEKQLTAREVLERYRAGAEAEDVSAPFETPMDLQAIMDRLKAEAGAP